VDQRHGTFEAAHLAMPSCALTPDGVREQRQRQAILAPSVASSTLASGRLVVDFRDDYDRQALDDMIAVERECCPFFVFDFDEKAPRLEVRVRDHEHAPALDAIASILTPA
jgi:hypothetical protein